MVEDNSSASSDDQQVDAALTSASSSPDAAEVDDSNSTTPDAEALYNDDDSVDSSATSGAPGMKAGRHSAFTSSPYTTPDVERDGETSSVETSHGTHDTPDAEKDSDSDDDDSQDNLNVEITDEDIERMMMRVKATDHGFLGGCSDAWLAAKSFAVGDTYECIGDNDDK